MLLHCIAIEIFDYHSHNRVASPCTRLESACVWPTDPGGLSYLAVRPQLARTALLYNINILLLPNL